MKTITLKLTCDEIMTLDFNNSQNCNLDNSFLFNCEAQRKNIKISSDEILLLDVDKFRDFLNNEIHSLEIKSRDEYGHSDNLNDLKSILSKLNKDIK